MRSPAPNMWHSKCLLVKVKDEADSELWCHLSLKEWSNVRSVRPLLTLQTANGKSFWIHFTSTCKHVYLKAKTHTQKKTQADTDIISSIRYCFSIRAQERIYVEKKSNSKVLSIPAAVSSLHQRLNTAEFARVSVSHTKSPLVSQSCLTKRSIWRAASHQSEKASQRFRTKTFAVS